MKPLTPKQRKELEAILTRAEPYPEDDPILLQFDGERNNARVLATTAKKILDNQLK